MPKFIVNLGIFLIVTGQPKFLMVVYATSNRANHFSRITILDKP